MVITTFKIEREMLNRTQLAMLEMFNWFSCSTTQVFGTMELWTITIDGDFVVGTTRENWGGMLVFLRNIGLNLEDLEWSYENAD